MYHNNTVKILLFLFGCDNFRCAQVSLILSFIFGCLNIFCMVSNSFIFSLKPSLFGCSSKTSQTNIYLKYPVESVFFDASLLPLFFFISCTNFSVLFCATD